MAPVNQNGRPFLFDYGPYQQVLFTPSLKTHALMNCTAFGERLLPVVDQFVGICCRSVRNVVVAFIDRSGHTVLVLSSMSSEANWLNRFAAVNLWVEMDQRFRQAHHRLVGVQLDSCDPFFGLAPLGGKGLPAKCS